MLLLLNAYIVSFGLNFFLNPKVNTDTGFRYLVVNLPILIMTVFFFLVFKGV